jgi:hypothetical protein
MYEVLTKKQVKAGRSTVRCPYCKMPVTRWQKQKLLEQGSIFCQNLSCEGYLFGLEDADIAVLPGSAKFFDTDAVRPATWYHATYMENWMGTVLTNDHCYLPILHIGTRQSALDRAKHQGYSYLYSIKVDEDATINPTVVDDATDGWDEYAEDYQYGITRYVNRWESPGSISLLANPLAITVISVTDLD